MDRNEQILRIEALRAAVHQHDYEQAMEIADELDLRKIRDNNLLSMIAEVYQLNHEYVKAKDALLTAYENTNSGRQLAYRLCLISIKTKEFDDAEEFYEDFVEMAPRDSARYILKYKMAKAKKEPLEKQIEILEEYVNIDMEEKWAYELAKLYHLDGNKEKCVDLCDEISLWFAEGKYVLKALELKKLYEPLSGTQQQKYAEGKQKRLEDASKDESSFKQEDSSNEESSIEQKSSSEQEFSEEQDFDKSQDTVEISAKNQEEHSPVEMEEIDETPQLDDFDDLQIGTGDGSEFDTVDIQAVVAEGMKAVEIKEENIHEDEGATKIAVGSIPFQKIPQKSESSASDSVQEMKEEPSKNLAEEETTQKTDSLPEIEEAQKTDSLPEIEEVQKADSLPEIEKEQKAESLPETEEELPEVHNLGDIRDILKQLQSRGILKEETVLQAVTIIEEAGNEENKEIEEELAKIDAGLDELEEESKKADVQLEETEVQPEKPADTLEEPENQPESDVEENQPEPAEDSMEDTDDPVRKDAETNDLSSTQNFSANVEVLSGVDWTQKEEEAEESTPEETVSTPDKEEKQTEELSDVASAETMITEPAEQREQKPEKQPKEIKIAEPGVTLSEEEMSVFKNYLNVEGLEESIRETIEDLIDLYTPDGKSTEGNVIILGEEKTGKTTLAIELIKLVNKKRGRRNRKLAKVQASALNRRGFKNSLSKLIGCDLIVENAHELGIMTVSEVIDAAGMFTDDMLIILEGDTSKMQDIITKTPRISEVFNYVIQIREYDIKEWVNYGKKYAMEQGYAMDELASLAFYKAIDDCFGAHKGIGKEDVESILDDAIHRNRRKLFKQKKNENDLVLLVEKNFR